MKGLSVITALLCTLLLASLTVLGHSQSREDQRKDTKAQPAKREKKSLSVSDADRQKYTEFLKSKNTGLIRLFPREKKYAVKADRRNIRTTATPGSFQRLSLGSTSREMSSENPPAQERGPSGAGTPSAANESKITNLDDLPRVDPRTENPGGTLRGDGAYYSFTQRTHEYGYSTDLSLDQGQFRAGFYGANYGFLANLGDVALETVDLNTPEAKLMAAYNRAEQEPEARREQRRFGQGVEIDGVKVKNRLPMRLNSTYLLRAVNYDESDVLVAFRVVEIDADGSPLILWKQLKRYSTPPLARKN